MEGSTELLCSSRSLPEEGAIKEFEVALRLVVEMGSAIACVLTIQPSSHLDF